VIHHAVYMTPDKMQNAEAVNTKIWICIRSGNIGYR